MKNRLNAAAIEAFKAYYKHRDEQDKIPWDKEADRARMFKTIKSSGKVTYMQAVTGTVWVTWSKGIQTVHDENNFRTGRIIARWIKGKWKKVGSFV